VLSNWPIRRKLLLGLGMLVLVVAILSSTGLVATSAYRGLVKSLSWRVSELPLAAELNQTVTDLRITIGELRGLQADSFPDAHRNQMPLRVRMVRDQFRGQLEQVERMLARYREQIEHESRADPRMSDHGRERKTVRKIEVQLERIRAADRDEDWMLDNVDRIVWLDEELRELQRLSLELPSHLHEKLAGFSHEVRGQYAVLIASAWIATISAGMIFLLFVRFSYRWVFRPLRTLVAGSRRVAGGDFDFRIRLDGRDEIAELARAMNDMTARFQEIRDDLDRQVQERTKQAVRSEQLASVGFLAAGVAHEINNPLAAIAIAAESLEGRMRDCPAAADQSWRKVVDDYLRMIQSEAFRCKGITEKLLDFSRIGPPRRERIELGELVGGVIEMLGHLGKYQRRRIEFSSAAPVWVEVNPQEIKQVVLNLLSNALDSLDDGGLVNVALVAADGWAELAVVDNGCGMSAETLERVFEPFFTRRRGGQGTGLGLSITYRIVADHGGEIHAESPGEGRGSTFRVRLPLPIEGKEHAHYSRAA
jgi:two-component system NtrC family sensor kinase